MNPNVIKEYAQLTLARDRYFAAQRPVPQQVVRRIQEIEAWGQTRFSPEQRSQALWYAEQEKTHLLAREANQQEAVSQQTRQQTEALRQANVDTLARRISAKAGIDAQTSEEFHRILRGKSITRGTPKPVKVAPKTLDEATKQATAHIDARGEGFTAKEWKQKLDGLWDYHGTHQWKEKVAAAGLRGAKALSEAMVRFQHEEMVRRLSPEPEPVHEVKPEERDIRRAVIAKEMAEHLAEEGTDEELAEFHRPELLNSAKEIVEDRYGYEGDSLRKDLAKVILEKHPEDEAPEIRHEYTDTFEDDDDV